MRGSARVVVASNRGPVSFVVGDDGQFTLRRGAGGLVSAVSVASGNGESVWVCSALSPHDRRAAKEAPNGRLDRAGHETGGSAVRMLDIDEATFHRAYNAVANSTLWYVNHSIYDTPHNPSFDLRFDREWQSYVDYNRAFADAIAEEAAPAAKVLVQDYHLTLVPKMLRDLRPDVRIGHFVHTPWAVPSYFSILPDDVSRYVLEGILGADSVGFLSPRGKEAFLDCCAQLLDAKVDGDDVTLDGHTTKACVHALGVDGDELRERAAQPDVQTRIETLGVRVAERQMILRIDRTELSKNIVRGLAAYRELLRTHQEHHGHVVHLVFAYPSRHDLPEYRAYTGEVQRIAHEIEDEFATADWSPIVLAVNDDYPRSLAAYRIADVLVVNPIRDGMNLVAKEGPVLSERGLSLVLSREAGAYDELGDDAIVVNPYDVSQTAEAMHRALNTPPAERAQRSARLAAAATAMPPRDWFAAQLAALD